MASPSLFRNASRPDLYVCARCAFRASTASSKTTKRWIGLKYLKKVADAENAWQAKALQIEAGKQKSMLTILEERGLVHQITGSRDAIDKMMTSKRLGAYVGIDPTASSLHVGHLLPLMSLFWMYVHGFHTVSLIGGATSKIGDPTDRLTTREKQHSLTRTQNMANMHYQMKKLWLNVETYGRKYGYNWEWSWHRELVNNFAWMNKLTLMEFLQVLGPGMRMGAMLARDTVKNKMEKGDGMSYAEFSYPLLQAWDWWHMYYTKGISMQIGGSDQFGNITAGIDAVKYISANHPNPVVREAKRDVPIGFTVPLLTTSSGAKFGKSAGNAIWLDREQTSSFDLYGYFLRTSDADVGKYLKLFTFMPIEKVEELVKEHMESPSQRKAQHALAREFLELVHGVDEAKHAETQHRLIFQGKAAPFLSPEITAAEHGTAAQINLNNRPKANITLPRGLICTKSIGRILYACGLASSASEGHRLADHQAVYVGAPSSGKKTAMNDGALSFTPVKTWFVEDTKKFLIDDELLILRRGKHNVRIIKVVPDEEYIASGSTFPGSEKQWRLQTQEELDAMANDYETDVAMVKRMSRKERRALQRPTTQTDEFETPETEEEESQDQLEFEDAEIEERKTLLKQDIKAALAGIKRQSLPERAAQVAQLKVDAAQLGPAKIDKIWYKRIDELNNALDEDRLQGSASRKEVAHQRMERKKGRRRQKLAEFSEREASF